MTISLTYDEVKALEPCFGEFRYVAKRLGGAKGWNGHKIDAQVARKKGVSFDSILWVASALAKTDKDVERRLRLWMADCAARVLHIYEKTEQSDAPRKAIIATRKYAWGKIDDATKAAAWVAAGDAAWDAAGDAAWVAAGAAARDAARVAAGAAAWDAAWNAAGAAARDAARVAAGAAEKEWQFNRLILWLSDKEPCCLRLPKKPVVSENGK